MAEEESAAFRPSEPSVAHDNDDDAADVFHTPANSPAAAFLDPEMVEDDGEGGEARAQGGQKRSADMLVEGDTDGDGEGAVGTAGGEAEDLADRSRPRPRLEE